MTSKPEELASLVPEQRVLELLGKSTAPVRTIELARQVIGAGSTRKSINPLLYRLQTEGKIMKISEANGGNPRWALVPGAKTAAPLVPAASSPLEGSEQADD